MMRHQTRKIFTFTSTGLIVVLLLYGLLIEPNRLEVRHLEVKNTSLSHALKGKTAVHLSDLHISKMGKREKKILKILGDLKPDLIFLTGDYVKWKGNYEEAINFLSGLDAPMGVWAVMGDYDYSSSRKSCQFCHEQGSGKATGRHHATFLRNTIKQFNHSNGIAWLGGVDPESSFNIYSEIPSRLLKDKSPAILLSHNPLAFDLIGNDHDVLILAGDTHGGQLPLPPWLWQLLGYRKNSLYNHGFFQDDRKEMYVSRGIGTSHVPIRFLSAPELVVFHF